MDCQQIMDIFLETGVIRKGHFQLTSGRHSDMLLSSANLFEYPEYSELFAKELTSFFADEEIDYVIGLAMGGVILAYEVAKQLNVKNIYLERVNGKMVFRRGFSVSPGQRVLIVEDIVTTGASLNEVVDLLQDMKVDVVGIGVIVDRSSGRVDFSVPINRLIDIDISSYSLDECPFCKEGLPLERTELIRRTNTLWSAIEKIVL